MACWHANVNGTHIKPALMSHRVKDLQKCIRVPFSAAGLYIVTSNFVVDPRRMLRISEFLCERSQLSSYKNFNHYIFPLKMATEIVAETLVVSQFSTRLISKSIVIRIMLCWFNKIHDILSTPGVP